MSQAGKFLLGSGGTPIDTITGNSGGAVGPNIMGNINLVGGNNITVVGSPGTNTLTASVTGTTNHAVQVGNASGSLNSIAVGTNGQLLIASTGADPSFVTPTAGTGLSITTNATTLSYALTTPVTVPNGGTGQTSFTAHGVILGEAAAALGVSNAGTNGQLLIAATGADPAFASLTSTGGTITFSTGANSLNLEASSIAVNSYTSVSSTPYVVTGTDYYLGVDSSGGAIAIQLPASPTTGRTFVIKDTTGSAATFNITVSVVGGVKTIDGSTSFVLNATHIAIQVIYNGTNYEVF